MKINIELELHPNTERPNVDKSLEFNDRFRNSRVYVVCQKRDYVGELQYTDGDNRSGASVGSPLSIKIPWSEVDGWIAVSELKEQVMKASGK